MLTKIENDSWTGILKEDPVRPHLSSTFRLSADRIVLVLTDEDAYNAEAVTCIAFTNEVPTNEEELDTFSQQACQDNQKGTIAVFYTVWSYKRGSGREIINKGLTWLKENYPHVNKFVTLSPKTEMAKKFHTKNGATLYSENIDSYNFEYKG